LTGVRNIKMAKLRAKRVRRKRASANITGLQKLKNESDMVPTFYVNGQPYYYTPISLYIFNEFNPFRQWCVQIIVSTYFEYFIVFVILVNAVFLACADYGSVDSDNNLVVNGSIRNLILQESTLPFTIIFVGEVILKIVAMGVLGKRSYLADPWNYLDLLVALSSVALLAYPNSPKISIIRTFRILRPLRTISSMPALKNIVNCIFGSLPQLGGVFLLLLFVFIFYATASVQFYAGPYMHSLCRSTPFPVNNSWVDGLDYSLYRCIPGVNFDTLADDPTMTKSSSPWAEPQTDCYWPLADSSILSFQTTSYRFCSFGKMYGSNFCPHDTSHIDESLWSWCGSNFDAYGNSRFGHSLDHDPDVYYYDLNWGFTNFDNFGKSLITIFQVITAEGWSYIMYFLMDSAGKSTAAAFFVSLMLLGSIFTLQLLLAVLADNFNSVSFDMYQLNDEDGDELKSQSGQYLDQLMNDSDSSDEELEEILQDIAAADKKSPNQSTKIRNFQSARRSSLRRNSLNLDEGGVIQEIKKSRIVEFYESFMTGFYYFRKKIYKSFIKLRKYCFIIGHTSRFDSFSCLLICANAIIFMLDHYPIQTTFSNALDIINALLAILFTIELIIKVLGSSIKKYFRDYFKLFDFVIVTVALIEVIIQPPAYFTGGQTKSSGISISIVRCFRLFRMIKLAIRFESLKILLTRILKTFLDLFSFMILLFLFLFICTLIGMQFFANSFRFDVHGHVIKNVNSYEWKHAYEISRYNFDDFNNAFASVFQIMSTENWNVILSNCWRAKGAAAVIFPCICIAFGTYILMNLFLAILLSNFESIKLFKEKETDKNEDGNDDVKDEVDNNVDEEDVTQTCVPFMNSMNASEDEPIDESSESAAESDPKKSNNIINKFKSASSLLKSSFSNKVKPLFGNNSVATPREENIDSGSNGVEPSNNIVGKLKSASSVLRRSFSNQIKPILDNNKLKMAGIANLLKAKSKLKSAVETAAAEEAKKYSLFCLRRDLWLRKLCTKIVNFKGFDNYVLMLVFISSVTLAIDSPLNNPKDQVSISLYYIDIVMTSLFSLEVIIKVIAFDLFYLDTAYLRSPWNVMDVVIVIFSIVSLFSNQNGLSALKALRCLRALRPLRVISRAPRLRVLVQAIIAAIPDVVNVLLVILLFFSLFTIIGVNLLKGDLRHCELDFEPPLAYDSYYQFLVSPVSFDKMSSTEKTMFGSTSRYYQSSWDCSNYPSESCCPVDLTGSVSSKDICECWGGSWTLVTSFNFDNFGSGLISFFSISTTEGWIDLMYAAVDSAGIGMEPIRNNRPALIYFFVLFIITGNFYALNLFVGVLLDNFQVMKKNFENNEAYLTDEQKEWIKTREIAMKFEPKRRINRPTNRFRGAMYDLTTHNSFEMTILMFIVANTVVLACDYYGSSDQYRYSTELLNAIFTTIFALEALFKIIAFGWRYFDNGWNQFDFCIVVGSISGLILLAITSQNVVLVITVARMFRALRVIRLINGFTSVKRLTSTVMLCLPGLVNIIMLLLLFIFIFTVLGVQLYATVGFYGTYDAHANFQSFGTGLLTLFRFASGEGWPQFMADVAHKRDNCVDYPEYNHNMCGFHDFPGCEELNGCGTFSIYVFMIAFTFFVTMCMFNLFIGVILEGFSEANDYNLTVKPEDLEKFSEHWTKYDPHATYYISFNDLEDFVMTLFSPLGYADATDINELEIQERIAALHIHVHTGGKVHFKDVICALSTEALRRKSGSAKGVESQILLDKFVKKQINANRDTINGASSIFKVSRYHFATVLVGVPGMHRIKDQIEALKDNGTKPITGFDGSYFTAKDYYAATYLQRSWKRKQWEKTHPFHSIDKLVKEIVRQNRAKMSIDAGELPNGTGDINRINTPPFSSTSRESSNTFEKKDEPEVEKSNFEIEYRQSEKV